MRTMFDLNSRTIWMRLTTRAELTAEIFDAIGVFGKEVTPSYLMVIEEAAGGRCLKQGQRAQA